MGDDGKLLLEGKPVALKNEMGKYIEDELKRSKGSGIRKIQHRLRNKICGISEDNIRRHLDNSELYQEMSAKFGNRPPLTPIRARSVQTRHQIDLISMCGFPVVFNGITYKYVLSVLDVFSRFLWLRPMASKSSREVSKHLANIYMEHGQPKIIQHDRGGEFKGAISQLTQKLKTKVITSSAYHPQSQGKVERTHRTLRKKILFDLIRLKHHGTNWAKNMPKYCAAINDDPREELGWKSPFQIYFGRSNYQGMDASVESLLPNVIRNRHHDVLKSDLRFFIKNRKRMREAAGQASKRKARAMVAREIGKRPPSVYSINELVLLRLRNSKHHQPRRNHVIRGIVRQRKLRFHRYKIEYECPTDKKTKAGWFSVKDITGITCAKEKGKKHRERSFRCNKYYIPLSHKEKVKATGLPVLYDPPGDGNCQLSAISNQLQLIGIHRSAATLREEIVSDLSRNPVTPAGVHLREYVSNNFDQYLYDMGTDGTYGDHITLQRMSDVFGIQIFIASSLGPHATRLLTPGGNPADPLRPTVYIGHLAEGHGEHYLSLRGTGRHLEEYLNMIQEEGVDETAEEDIHEEGVDEAGKVIREENVDGAAEEEIQGEGGNESGGYVMQEQIVDNSHVLQEGVNEEEVIHEGVDEAEVIQEGVDEAEVIPEEGADEAEVIPEEGIDEAEVIQEGVYEAEVIQEGADEAEVIPEEGVDEAEVIQEGVDEAEVIQEGVDEAKVIPEEGVDEAGVIPEEGVDEAGVIPEEGVDEAEVIPGEGVDEAEVIPEEGVDEAEVIPEEGVDEAEVTQEKSVDEARKVQQAFLPEGDMRGCLPNEVMRSIIQQTLSMDMSMIHTFNRVSTNFRDITKDFYPTIHIPDDLARSVGIFDDHEHVISVQKLNRAAGRGSGLMQRIREILHHRRNWFNSWLTVTAVGLGCYVIKDIRWKKQ